MWTRTYSKTFQGISSKDIWCIWADVNSWPTWHGDLDYCGLDGDFKVGNHFMLKPKSVSPVKIMLTEIVEGHYFTDCTSFFGAKMYDTHSMIDTPDGLKLTNKFADTVPEEMERLVNLARGNNV